MSEHIDQQGGPGAHDERRSHDDRDPMRELHPDECWEFLAAREFGRLAYHLIDEVHIVPINYAVDDRRLVFLTAEGSKLLGLTMNSDVAFEVDEIEGEQAVSVIVPRTRPPARRLRRPGSPTACLCGPGSTRRSTSSSRSSPTR